jgi:hypothetical protein
MAATQREQGKRKKEAKGKIGCDNGGGEVGCDFTTPAHTPTTHHALHAKLSFVSIGNP